MPKISVIIPVYNAEKYLRDCLDSIRGQAADFEVILIDDGSTDSSGAVCNEYAEKDSRFKVIHCQNSGPANARNHGLEQAKGKWITFVDADDLIEPDYLSIPSNSYNDDVIFINFATLEENLIKYKGDDIVSETITNSDDLNKIKYQAFDVFSRQPYRKTGYTCGKFYKGDIIRRYNIRFPKDFWFYEDAIFFWNFMEYVKCVHFMENNTPHYIYRNNSNSLTQNVCYETILKRKDFLLWVDKNLYSQQSQEALNRFFLDQFMLIVNGYLQICKNFKEWISVIREIYKWEPIKHIVNKSLVIHVKERKQFTPVIKAFYLVKTRGVYLYGWYKFMKTRYFK